MKTKRILEFAFLVSLAVVLFYLTNNWWALLPQHLIAGAWAFRQGFSDQVVVRRFDSTELCMLCISTSLGFLSLFITTFTEMEGHDDQVDN